ncbi:hypothetical protein PAXRUDRAFT_827836 [Paxillus rubicundulus Ve08.2h10]|uniref:Unplaced genomic scaffold scaffold_274, whole genome shotgun sequence n=1 Tax=Paxillus rubicundulus Ve08.2h10 TaxID=930991 RepID=A0A0D0E842_9AGAM|nr:hypothetical protein PAXRUDRAFT_827836 [Paxillus rubicundulus Ve08.2h10]
MANLILSYALKPVHASLKPPFSGPLASHPSHTQPTSHRTPTTRPLCHEIDTRHFFVPVVALRKLGRIVSENAERWQAMSVHFLRGLDSFVRCQMPAPEKLEISSQRTPSVAV